MKMAKSKNHNVYLPEDVLIPYFGIESKLTGVEIGVMGGCGSILMLKRMPNLNLYCIDPWKHVDGGESIARYNQEVNDNNYNTTKHRLSAVIDRAVLIRKRSDDAVKDVPDTVDFVHIDGDHKYQQVINDIKNYFPKIKIGGMISGHDYESQWGVKKAVDELLKDYKVHHGDDWVWWAYKDKEASWEKQMGT